MNSDTAGHLAAGGADCSGSPLSGPRLEHGDLAPVPGGVGPIEGQRGGQVPVGVYRILQTGDLLLGQGDRIGAGETGRGRILAGDHQQRLGELGGVAVIRTLATAPQRTLTTAKAQPEGLKRIRRLT